MARVVTVTVGDKTLECPILEGSEREMGFDIAKLRAETGYITFDPAYGNTGACKSAITFIDAELERFFARVAASAQLYPGFEKHLAVYPRDAQPMAILSAMINNLSCFNQDLANPDSQGEFEEVAARLISKMTTIGAAIYRSQRGLPFVAP